MKLIKKLQNGGDAQNNSDEVFVSPFYIKAMQAAVSKPEYITNQDLTANVPEPYFADIPRISSEMLSEKEDNLYNEFKNNGGEDFGGLYRSSIYPIPKDSTKTVRILSNPNSKAHTGYINTNVWDTIAYYLGRNPDMPLSEGFGLAEQESGTGRDRSYNDTINPIGLFSAWDFEKQDPYSQALNYPREKIVHSDEYVNLKNKRSSLVEELHTISQELNQLDELSPRYKELTDRQSTIMDQISQLGSRRHDLLVGGMYGALDKINIQQVAKQSQKFTPNLDLYNWVFNHYLKGGYNPGDSTYYDKVRKQGEELLKTKEWQKWWEKSGKQQYERGQRSLKK